MKLLGEEKCQNHIAFLVADRDYSPDFLFPGLIQCPMHKTTLLSFLGFPDAKADSCDLVIPSQHSYTAIIIKASITQ